MSNEEDPGIAMDSPVGGLTDDEAYRLWLEAVWAPEQSAVARRTVASDVGWYWLALVGDALMLIGLGAMVLWLALTNEMSVLCLFPFVVFGGLWLVLRFRDAVGRGVIGPLTAYGLASARRAIRPPPRERAPHGTLDAAAAIGEHVAAPALLQLDIRSSHLARQADRLFEAAVRAERLAQSLSSPEARLNETKLAEDYVSRLRDGAMKCRELREALIADSSLVDAAREALSQEVERLRSLSAAESHLREMSGLTEPSLGSQGVREQLQGLILKGKQATSLVASIREDSAATELAIQEVAALGAEQSSAEK